MAEPGPSSNNRLKRQHSIEDHDSFNHERKKIKQEVSLFTEYETLELGLLSARSPGAQSLASPRSVTETPEVQARRDAQLRIAIQRQAELQNQVQSPKFPATMWRDGMIIGFSAETDRHIPSALKAKYPPLAPSLTRSLSSSSLASSFMLPSEPPKFAPNSSHEHLGVTKTSIDFTLPPLAFGDATTSQYEYLPMTCSVNNMFFFTRGNRLHYKNLHTSEDIAQLFKLKDKYGDIQVVQCGGIEQSNTLAVSTSKGYIHIWDVVSKKATMSWHTRDVGSMQWNGPVLTVGEVKGTIRFFDTRISPATKLKGEARKLIRHQTRITHLSWNENRKYLATGDDSGTVYCWDDRQKSPLDVGEFVQRRKKIQHDAAVTALSWCPWQHKYLGTGDANGTIRLWSIDPEESRPNVVGPNHTIRTGSRVSGLHFSSLCKEMISVHGKEAETLPWDNNPLIHRFPTPTANSIVAHTFPNSRHVKTLSVSNKPVAGSVMVGNGMKVIVAIPEEGKLKLCDVWGKPPPLKRQPSLVDKAMSSIR